MTGEGSAESWRSVRDLLGQAVEEAAHARRAGGSGTAVPPGALPGDWGPGGRDDLGRIDSELLAAGIHPGHPSLYQPPDAPDTAEDRDAAGGLDAAAGPGAPEDADRAHGTR